MSNPFAEILKKKNFDPDVNGPGIKDESVNEQGDRDLEYARQVKAIFENPAFKKEYDLHLQYIWHAMTKDSFEACNIAAAFFNEFYNRFKTIASEVDEMEAKKGPVDFEGVDPADAKQEKDLNDKSEPSGEAMPPDGSGLDI